MERPGVELAIFRSRVRRYRTTLAVLQYYGYGILGQRRPAQSEGLFQLNPVRTTFHSSAQSLRFSRSRTLRPVLPITQPRTDDHPSVSVLGLSSGSSR